MLSKTGVALRARCCWLRVFGVSARCGMRKPNTRASVKPRRVHFSCLTWLARRPVPHTVVSGTDLPHLVSGRPGYHAVLAFAIRPVAGTVARYEGIDDETTDRGIGSGCPGSGRFGRRGHRSEED